MSFLKPTGIASDMCDDSSSLSSSSLEVEQVPGTHFLPPTYATLSFHKADILRLLNFPSDIVSAVESLILASWPPGIEKQYPSGQAFEFKLRGRPFGTFRAQQFIGGIHVVRVVFALLRRHGWDLTLSTVCSTRYTAKDTLVFHRSPVPLSEVEWLALAPAGDRRLRVVYDSGVGGHSQADQDRQNHMVVLNTAIQNTLEELGYFKESSWSHDTREFLLKGKPWKPKPAESVKVRVLLIRLLATMEQCGWRPYTALVQRTGQDDYRMVDTWYFVRDIASPGVADAPEARS
jgi:hypothetical protein